MSLKLKPTLLQERPVEKVHQQRIRLNSKKRLRKNSSESMGFAKPPPAPGTASARTTGSIASVAAMAAFSSTTLLAEPNFQGDCKVFVRRVLTKNTSND